jgi:hypothetical protein
MSIPFRFFVWFPSSARWVHATAQGAQERFTIWGQEVAYGRHPPCRTGEHADSFDPLFRLDRWHRFIACCNAKPHARHRIGSV